MLWFGCSLKNENDTLGKIAKDYIIKNTITVPLLSFVLLLTWMCTALIWLL